jgi:transcription-repair coupling factor (superfamily II helicase)
MIQRLVPNAKLELATDKWKEAGKLMLAFMNGEFDVLVATTIIESGLDVPNADFLSITLIILVCLICIKCVDVWAEAIKKLCYFICPPYSAMTDDARRIQALEQFSDLGSGFNIAMKDLEFVVLEFIGWGTKWFYQRNRLPIRKS